MMRVKRILLLVIVLIFMSSLAAIAAEMKPDFYLRHDETNQESTAYNSEAGQYPAGGGNYYVGVVAVHPKVAGGSVLDPIIPFGTVIWLTSPSSITIQGTAYNHFTVMDTGDRYWTLHHNSPKWIDIYFGQAVQGDMSDPDYVAALLYGNSNRVSYYWNEWIN